MKKIHEDSETGNNSRPEVVDAGRRVKDGTQKSRCSRTGEKKMRQTLQRPWQQRQESSHRTVYNRKARCSGKTESNCYAIALIYVT